MLCADAADDRKEDDKLYQQKQEAIRQDEEQYRQRQEARKQDEERYRQKQEEATPGVTPPTTPP